MVGQPKTTRTSTTVEIPRLVNTEFNMTMPPSNSGMAKKMSVNRP